MNLVPKSILSELSIKQIVEEKEKLEKNIKKLFEDFEEKTNTKIREISICKWSDGYESIQIGINTGI
ncbi:unnamed protein product [marine sediment metagenome]|uniref:Uncharacterized protein n=1 Tax=marine sediment metagenome TaxID=412755 RepID=X0XL82_9ZZZZ